MDDFERELTRMMREGPAHTPFDPGHRARLYDGIRARRRTRVLVRAGGSALAVAGLSVGLAFLPQLGSGPAPADLPLPATGSTAPPRSGGPTGTAEPSSSEPPTSSSDSSTPGGDSPVGTTEPATTDAGSTASGSASPDTTESGTSEPGHNGTPTYPPPGG
ncbi:cellulase [Streptomyces thermocarboxydus]|uniref:cellulase n=1 Tax=Streptomyces thermocarboxydus TaxID=59299 RepID=UPI0025C743CE|nr:cellulase [Streptomyces thermocarboxydus]